MGPVRKKPIQSTVSLFICVCIALCTIVAHNIAQNRPDNFPPYPPDNHHSSDDVYLREGGGVLNINIVVSVLQPIVIFDAQILTFVFFSTLNSITATNYARNRTFYLSKSA